VYVLEGVLRYTVGSETRDLRPGDTMATPRGDVHGVSNPHSATARALILNTPDIGAQYFARSRRSSIQLGHLMSADSSRSCGGPDWFPARLTDHL
jgi:uncharacterized cupin superfamily protein